MFEGFFFGLGFWASLLAISLAVALLCFVVLFVSYLVKGRKGDDGKPSNVISSDDLWGR